MSQASWKREFYPLSADALEAKVRYSDQAELKAAQHSLKKWRGLTAEALNKHKLVKAPIAVDSNTCALCQLHKESDFAVPQCGDCILTRVRDTPCDTMVTFDSPSPYIAFTDDGDAKPMIKLLETAVKVLKRESK